MTLLFMLSAALAASPDTLPTDAVARCLARAFSAEVCEALAEEAANGRYQVGRAGACEALAGSLVGGGVSANDVISAELSALMMESDDPLVASFGAAIAVADVLSCIGDALEAVPEPRSRPERRATPEPRTQRREPATPRRAAPRSTSPALSELDQARRSPRRGVTLCNSTDEEVTLAVAFREGSKWRSEGWWYVDSGECVHPTNADPRGSSFRLYAKSKSRRWGGDQPHCTDSDAFNVADSEVDARGGGSDCRLWSAFRPIYTDRRAAVIELQPTLQVPTAVPGDRAFVDGVAPASAVWPHGFVRIRINDDWGCRDGAQKALTAVAARHVPWDADHQGWAGRSGYVHLRARHRRSGVRLREIWHPLDLYYRLTDVRDQRTHEWFKSMRQDMESTFNEWCTSVNDRLIFINVD